MRLEPLGAVDGRCTVFHDPHGATSLILPLLQQHVGNRLARSGFGERKPLAALYRPDLAVSCRDIGAHHFPPRQNAANRRPATTERTVQSVTVRMIAAVRLISRLPRHRLLSWRVRESQPPPRFHRPLQPRMNWYERKIWNDERRSYRQDRERTYRRRRQCSDW